MNSSIAILIPCYNENKTIQKVISDFRLALPDSKIYVFDNNSSDGSADLAEQAGAIVIREYRQGKGNVIRSMFQKIDADCYIMVDADDTYPAEIAPELAKFILSKEADMVIGDRLSSTYFFENKRAFHNFGNKFVRYLINWIFNSNIKDIMSGYRAFSKVFIKNFPVFSSGFEIETEMTIHALDKKFLIKELPVQYRDRPEDSPSKLNTIEDGLKVLYTIFNLFKDLRPLAFFGLIAVIGLLVSVILLIPIFIEYFETGLVPRFPTLIAAGFITVVSLLSFFCGIILDSINKHKKFFYELQITNWHQNHK